MRCAIAYGASNAAVGDIAEVLGSLFDPTGPVCGDGAMVGEATFVVEPVGEARLEQAEPDMHAERAGVSCCGPNGLERSAVELVVSR